MRIADASSGNGDMNDSESKSLEQGDIPRFLNRVKDDDVATKVRSASDDPFNHLSPDTHPLEVGVNRHANDMNMLIVHVELESADDAPVDLSDEARSCVGPGLLPRYIFVGRPVDGAQTVERGCANLRRIDVVIRVRNSNGDHTRRLGHRTSRSQRALDP